MVAHLVRLKLTLLRNGLRRSAWQVVGLVIGGLYASGIVVGLVVALAVLSSQDVALRRTAVVLGGAALVLGWWVLPLVAFGVDATMETDRFSTFAIPRRDLVVGLAVAGLIGIPGVATTLVAGGTVLTWWREPLAALAALVGAALGVVLCVVGSRTTTTVLAPLLAARRFREVAAVVVIVPLALLGPIFTGLGAVLEEFGSRLPRIADWAAWTPFGAPWALASDVSQGRWLDLAGHLAVAVAGIAVLALAWGNGLARAMAPRGSSESTRHVGIGLFSRFPATPVGAVAARCLTYWFRDPRYAAAVLVVPLLPVIAWFMGRGGALLGIGPVAGMLLGWSISADVSYDGTAFWMHVMAPLRGRADRVGRVVAAAVLGVPATLAICVLGLAVSGRWDLGLPVVALSLGALASALGVSSVASARLVYPVVPAGSSPFASRQGGTTAAMLAQLVGFLLLGALGVPGLVLTIVAAVSGSAVMGAVSAVVSTAIGATVLLVGLRKGGDMLDVRAPVLLQTLRAMA